MTEYTRMFPIFVHITVSSLYFVQFGIVVLSPYHLKHDIPVCLYIEVVHLAIVQMSDTAKSARKRRLKAQYRAQAKRSRFGSDFPGSSHQLQPGVRGFFCTTNGNEKFSVREVYNLLNEYAVKLYGEEYSDYGGDNGPTGKCRDSVHSEDLTLEQELNLLRGQSSSSSLPHHRPSTPAGRCGDDDEATRASPALDENGSKRSNNNNNNRPARRFQQIKCPVNGCIFIKTTLSECAPLVESMMQDICENGVRRARFTSRIVPVQFVCKANAEALVKSCRTLIEQRLSDCSDSFSYSVVYKSRHGCCISWQDTRHTIMKTMASVCPESRALVQNADWYFLVEGIANTLLLSLVKDYQRLSLFNLQKIATRTEDGKQQQQAPKQEVEEESGADPILDSGEKEAGVVYDNSNETESDAVNGHEEEKEVSDYSRESNSQNVRHEEVEEVVGDSGEGDSEEDNQNGLDTVSDQHCNRREISCQPDG